MRRIVRCGKGMQREKGGTDCVRDREDLAVLSHEVGGGCWRVTVRRGLRGRVYTEG